MHILSVNPNRKQNQRGQGLVEFALAIPVFLLLVFGVIEFGRLLMTYSAVFSASREAARYGAAVGTTDAGVRYDHDCDGMRAAAVRVGGLGGVQASQVVIELLNPDGTVKDGAWCTEDNSLKESNLSDIIKVSVNGRFWPILPLVNLPYLPVISSSSRTIVENVEVLGTPQPTTVPPVNMNALILTLDINPPGSGIIHKSPDKATYQYGDVVTLTVEAYTGWGFSNWTQDLSGAANPTTITMNNNKTVTANFIKVDYTLTVNHNPAEGGTATVNPNTPTHPSGETVTVTANPAPGYTFASWSGDVTSTDPTVSFTMNSNKTITASYNRIPYTLTITVEGQGTVNRSQNGPYYYGDRVTLTAVPDAGWDFTSWSGSMIGSANPKVLTITGNATVNAKFEQGNYILNVNIIGNGQVVKSPDQASYPPGTLVTITATPSPGWLFSAWGGDVSSGSPNPYTVTMDRDKNVNANFTEISYTLTITVVGQGNVTTNKSAPYHMNDVVQLSVTPALGWTFSGWSGDLTGSASPVDLTITGNRAVTATFIPIEYTLVVNVVGQGNVVLNPLQATYHYGDVVQLTANPQAGWAFALWSGDLNGTTSPASLTINGNKTVTATFTRTCASPDLIQVTMTGGVGSADVNFQVTNASDFDVDIMSMNVTWSTSHASGKLTDIFLGSTAIWNGSINKNSSPYTVSTWITGVSRTITAQSSATIRVHFESNVDSASITPMTFSNVCAR